MTPAELRRLSEWCTESQTLQYALRQAVDAIEQLERELGEAKRRAHVMSDWFDAQECRHDDDCDHCLGLQILNDWPVEDGADADVGRPLPITSLRAQVETLTKERDAAQALARHHEERASGYEAAMARAERERDEALSDSGNACVLADFAKRERDAARAQVDLLAKVLREIASFQHQYTDVNKTHLPEACADCIAREALKAAGLEETK